MNSKLLTAIFWLMLGAAACGQTIIDPGFEVPGQGTTKFTHQPVGSAWTFTGGAGLTGNSSGFSSSQVAPQGGQVALLQNVSAISQVVTAWQPGTYQVSFRAAQRGNWPSPGGGNQSIQVLVDGQPVSTITPIGARYQAYYTAAFPVQAGDHTLALQGGGVAGDNTAFVDAISIIPAGSVAPTVAALAQVASSGKMIILHFAMIGSGQPVIPSQIVTAPTLSVNGQPIGQLGTQWLTGYHPVALLATPSNYQIRPGDQVTLTAPIGWSFSGSGFVQELVGAAAENRAGKPMLATENLPRTLRTGINNNQNPTSNGLGFYFPFKNIKYRLAWPPGNRGRLVAGQFAQSLSYSPVANGIDQTKYPGIAGQWLVMWDANNATAPVQFSITTATKTQCTVTERADLAHTSPDGTGLCRVFDVQPIAGQPSAEFDVSLSINDPAWTGKPSYSNLWVVQPGDWDIVAGQVVLDRSDPLALSRIYVDRVGPNIGSMRWVDSTVCGGNPTSCPYPEFLPNVTDESWGDLSFYREIRGYTAAGPVDVKATPYIYSPFFRQPGQSFTATLAADITTAPATGTRETWTFTDADTAPLMAGLELFANGEVCRILSGAGQTWTVIRGSNGTTPTTHAAGAISVSGRRNTTDVLNLSGTRPSCQVVQLTTATPHNRTTGNSFSFNGSGWPVMSFSDGTKQNLQNLGNSGYVTGPNTFFVVTNGVQISKVTGAVPTQVYPLDPAKQTWEYRSGGGIPIEAAAIATGRFQHADFHVNIPIDSVDDMVWEIARRVLANFPAGRRVYAEYGNEPWNWAFTSPFYHGFMGTLAVPGNPYPLVHYAMRSGQVHQIFRQVFGAAGRAGEIHGLINCQMGNGSTQIKPHLEYGLAQGTPFDNVAIAPYWSTEDTPYNRRIMAMLDDEQAIDVVMADHRLNPRMNNAWADDANRAIAAYNQAHGAGVRLMGYEGGIDTADPSSQARNHDLIYNPNWYYSELDWIAWCQLKGFDRIHIYNLAMWWNPNGWGGYHTSQQRHSRGDGLNGATDNRAWRARGKAPTVNQDLHVDSVRGQAWLDWLGTVGP